MLYKDRKEGLPKGYFDIPRIDKDKKNKAAFFQLDMMTSKSFARNFGNHPRSDISLINEQQNLQAAQNLLNRLQVLPDDKRVGVSDSDLIANMRSKYCQSQGEMISYFENLLAARDAKIAAARAAAAAKVAAAAAVAGGSSSSGEGDK